MIRNKEEKLDKVREEPLPSLFLSLSFQLPPFPTISFFSSHVLLPNRFDSDSRNVMRRRSHTEWSLVTYRDSNLAVCANNFVERSFVIFCRKSNCRMHFRALTNSLSLSFSISGDRFCLPISEYNRIIVRMRIILNYCIAAD